MILEFQMKHYFIKQVFCTRRDTKKFNAEVSHTSIARAGRRRTNWLLAGAMPFHTKLLSHGDGKAMSRLYNSRIQAHAIPYAPTRK